MEDINRLADAYEFTKNDRQLLADLVDRTFLMGIKEGWEQSSPNHNFETHKEIDKVIKDVFEGLNAKK